MNHLENAVTMKIQIKLPPMTNRFVFRHYEEKNLDCLQQMNNILMNWRPWDISQINLIPNTVVCIGNRQI